MATGKKVEIEVRANVTGEESVGKLGRELNATGAAAKKLGTDASGAASGVGGADNAAKGFTGTAGKLRDGLDSVSTQLADAKTQMLAFVGVQGLAATAKNVAGLADAWANMKSRLQLALGAQADINQAMQGVEGVAKRTFTSLDATANLYGKIATAGRDMGVSQQAALKITETINQAIQLSGASAQASESAITQLIQGLQSGVVRGDEFNSIMEQSPRLAKAMADGIGVPIGALRGLSEEGKLTSRVVIEALQKQSAVIGKEFGSLPVTIGRAVQNLQTEWHKFVGTLDASSGASSAVAAGIESIGKHIDDLARIAATTGAAMVASFAIQAAGALRTAALEMAATGGAAGLLRVNLDKLSKPVVIAIAVTGFEIGFQIGTMLRDNSEWARKFGVAMTKVAITIVNDLKLIKEAAAAIFTSDTVGAAFDRYLARSKQLSDITKAMYADAEKAPTKIGDATDAAAGKTQALGSAATAAGAAAASAGAAGAAGVGKIGKAAEDARAALSGLATAINTLAPPDNGITSIVRDLAAAKARAVDVDQVLREQLPEAISKLNGPELAKFRNEFIRAMTEAGLKGKELRTGMALIAEEAAKNLGVNVPLALNKISKEFVEAEGNLSVLIRSMPELKAAGVDAGSAVAQALSKMIEGTKSQQEIDKVSASIVAMGKSGQVAKPQIDALLDSARDKALALRQAVEASVPGIQSLGEAAKKAGVDLDQLTSGVNKGFKDGLADIANLATELTKAGASAERAGPLLAKALDQKLTAAQTKEEVSLITAALTKLGNQGLLTGEQVRDGLQKAKGKADELTPGINSVTEAMKLLGVTSDETLRNTSKSFEGAYFKIVASGKASTRELADAFKKFAEAAIAANDGVASEWLQNEAALRGMEITADRTGKTIVRAFGEGAEGARHFGAAVDTATSALERQLNTQEKQVALQERQNGLIEREAELKRKRDNVDKEGFVLDKNGQRLTGTSLNPMGAYNKAKEGGGSEQLALRLSNDVQDGKYRDNRTGTFNYNKFFEDLNAAILSEKNKAAYEATPEFKRNQALVEERRSGTAPATATDSSTPASSTTVNVRITLPNGSVQTVPTTEAGSQALIAALQGAKLAAGY